jgi:hypothetical protein
MRAGEVVKKHWPLLAMIDSLSWRVAWRGLDGEG